MHRQPHFLTHGTPLRERAPLIRLKYLCWNSFGVIFREQLNNKSQHQECTNLDSIPIIAVCNSSRRVSTGCSLFASSPLSLSCVKRRRSFNCKNNPPHPGLGVSISQKFNAQLSLLWRITLMYQAFNVSGKINNKTEQNTIGTSTGPRMTEVTNNC